MSLARKFIPLANRVLVKRAEVVTKTASGSRTNKSNTSYSLQAAHRGGSGVNNAGTTSNEQLEENLLPQMSGVNR